MRGLPSYLKDKFEQPIHRGLLLRSDFDRVYEVIMDKDFGLSIKDLKLKTIEKLTDQITPLMEIIYYE